jgi:Ca2+-binding RTX toxin-like protein
MRIRAALAAAATGTGLLVGPTTAVAAAPMCRGKEATIVAGPAQKDVTGTDAADVIVALGRRADVDAGDGDDTICMRSGYVQGGFGNDSVTSSPDVHDFTSVVLGPGDDIYVGGPGEDELSEGDFEEPEGADTISTGAGFDHVTSGVPGEPNRDVIDLGPGHDALDLRGTSGSSARISAGTGEDALHLDNRGQAALVLDLVHGLLSREASSFWAVDGFEYYDIGAGRSTLRVIGSGGRDDVGAYAAAASVHMGSGRDTFVLTLSRSHARGVLDGGSGRDTLRVQQSRGRFVADLESEVLQMRGQGMAWRFTLRGFESLDAGVAAAAIRGDAGRNWLSVTGCSARVDGAGGDDVINSYFDRIGPNTACDAVLRGGPGDDRLRGDVNDDVLLGGEGTDTARGAQGTDTCVAEREFGCER